jgi:hypothetical protein
VLLDSRNPITIVAVIILTMFLLGAWVISQIDESYTVRLSELAVNKDLWEQTQPVSYQYTSAYGCMMLFSYKIEHEKGRDFEFPVGQTPANESVKIDDVFEQAEKAIRMSYSVEIKYHPYFGFPELIDVDWNKDIIDDECFFKISEFEVAAATEI